MKILPSAPQAAAKNRASAVLEDLVEALLDCADGAAWLAAVAARAEER